MRGQRAGLAVMRHTAAPATLDPHVGILRAVAELLEALTERLEAGDEMDGCHAGPSAFAMATIAA